VPTEQVQRHIKDLGSRSFGFFDRFHFGSERVQKQLERGSAICQELFELVQIRALAEMQLLWILISLGGVLPGLDCILPGRQRLAA
jgi:hypothetical protein